MHQTEENLRENRTTLMDLEIHVKLLFSEENSSLFIWIEHCRQKT